jgi:tetratricopeptide (TPR) repeat protein
LREALQFYRQATEIEEANAKADPTNTVSARSVSEDYIKIGEVLLKLGDRADALDGFLKALEIREQVAATSPESPGARVVSANLYESLGDFYFSKDLSQAKIRYEQSFGIWQDLRRENTILESDAKKPDELKKKIEKCKS